MIDARFQPLDRPAQGLHFERSPFRGSYSSTLRLLEGELRHLSATSITILAGYAKESIRLDGWPSSRARPTHPGVELHFLKTIGATARQLRFRAYRFHTFEANLRAIALALQALRSVDRYGVTDQAEQYGGFAKLPPASGGPTPEERKAAALLALVSKVANMDELLRDHEQARIAYRAAARATHPDLAPAGTADRDAAFREVQEAWECLEARQARIQKEGV